MPIDGLPVSMCDRLRSLSASSRIAIGLSGTGASRCFALTCSEERPLTERGLTHCDEVTRVCNDTTLQRTSRRAERANGRHLQFKRDCTRDGAPRSNQETTARGNRH
jgi:hypothetical protein